MTERWDKFIRNRLLAGVALSAVLCGSAVADPAPVFNWAGPYVGVNLGYIGARSRAQENDDSDGYLNVFSGARSHAGGILGGGQLGYNWQFGPTVLGIEGDLDYSGASSSGGNGGPLVDKEPATLSIRSKIDALGTVRGRIGYAFAPLPLLVYGTAGVAFGDVKNSFNSDWFKEPTNGSRSGWRGGWTVGGGVEYAFAANWTVRAEGLYVDLGSATISSNNNQSAYDHYIFNFRDTAVIGRAAINFKF